LVVLLLFMAQATSQLPSLFNETKVIYESALFSVVLLILGLGVIVVTDDPGTSPAVRYLVSVIWTLSIAANTSLRIMLPKLLMVWRNEKVVVSKLVSDHAKIVRENDARYANSGDTNNFIVTGLTPEEQEPSNFTTHSKSIEVADHDDDLVETKELMGATNTENMDSSPDSSAEFHQVPSESSGRPKPTNSFKQRLASLPSRRRSLASKILVQCDETPARRLVLKMVDLQEELTAVNDHIMSGVAVSEQEWTSVRELIGTLGSTFHDDVDFAWENNKKEGPTHASKGNLGGRELKKEVIVEGEEEEP
jgi:hypothetical protein